ncbi:MAG: hypothetical protein QM813_26410 [Verrucomicrobiota bacterium]
MKTLITSACLLISFIASAGPTNLLTLTYVNGTNTGNVTWVSNVYVPKERFMVQHTEITNTGYAGSYLTNGITNTIAIDWQVSVDGGNSNWLTLYTWKPTGTNAAVYNVNDEFDRIALAFRARVRTTNALGVAIYKQ